MIQPRPLQPASNLCCLPSPHRVLQGVAGMAFNFSRIEISHSTSTRKLARQHEKTQSQKEFLTALRG